MLISDWHTKSHYIPSISHQPPMYPYCTVDGCEILHLGWLKQQLKACDFAHFSTTAIFHIISPTINLHQHPYSMNITIFYQICFLLCIPYASWDNKPCSLTTARDWRGPKPQRSCPERWARRQGWVHRSDRYLAWKIGTNGESWWLQ
jgi:hypothetical protein